jgi:hypothetical protein
MLLPDELATQIFAGKLRDVTGEADIVGEEFSAGYECDAPSFGIMFVRVDREISHARISQAGHSVGCQQARAAEAKPRAADACR